MDCRALDRLLLDLPPDPLGGAPELPADAERHLAGCEACRARQAAQARLDRLLLGEPAPPAPLDLMAQVLEAVARRRARDLAWARRQVLVLVAAAALLVVALGLALGGGTAPDLDLVAEAARADLEAGAAAVALAVEGALDAAWAPIERAPGLPSPPVVLLVVLAPALVLLDSIVCRRAAAAGRAS